MEYQEINLQSGRRISTGEGGQLGRTEVHVCELVQIKWPRQGRREPLLWRDKRERKREEL